jgi:hypothetical protein
MSIRWNLCLTAHSVLCTNTIKRTVVPHLWGLKTVFVSASYYYDRDGHCPVLDPKNAEIYMGHELYLDGGNVVWSKDNFKKGSDIV